MALSINEAQDIMQEDQHRFDKTVAELKTKAALRSLGLLDSGQGEEPSDDKSSGG